MGDVLASKGEHVYQPYCDDGIRPKFVAGLDILE